MATYKREFVSQGGNTDPELDNNFNSLTGDGYLKGFIVHEETGVDLSSAADASTVSTDITVNGVALGDIVLGTSLGVDVSDLTIDGQVTAADTVTLTANNNTGGSVDLASTTVRFLIAQVR